MRSMECVRGHWVLWLRSFKFAEAARSCWELIAVSMPTLLLPCHPTPSAGFAPPGNWYRRVLTLSAQSMMCSSRADVFGSLELQQIHWAYLQLDSWSWSCSTGINLWRDLHLSLVQTCAGHLSWWICLLHFLQTTIWPMLLYIPDYVMHECNWCWICNSAALILLNCTISAEALFSVVLVSVLVSRCLRRRYFGIWSQNA